jgi:uncharacterized protein (DUF2062 family)
MTSLLKFANSLRTAFSKILRINDTSQRIALGLAIGVFLGILPALGFFTTLILASFLRVNRTSALIGMLLTNTWLTVVTFFLSIKLGAFIFRIDSQNLYESWNSFVKNFHWIDLFKASFLKLILPALTGYFLIALGLALTVYLLALLLLRLRKGAA